MFRKFEEFFGEKTIGSSVCLLSPYKAFIKKFGGKQFAQGLFNAFTQDDLKKMEKLLYKAYPGFTGNVKLFGYDWLGRIFGLAKKKGKEIVLLFEIGALDVLEIPCDFLSFLNGEIPDYHGECLASDFFNRWKSVGAPPKYGRCIGYKIPLFLGGEDALDNMEDSDLEVYWYLLSEIGSK